MLIRFRDKFPSVLLLLAISVSSLFAGRGDKAGTASGTQLMIPVGARSIGMGYSPLACIRGIESVPLNPAGLGFFGSKNQVMFSTMSWIADINVNYVSLATVLNDIGSLAFTLKSLAIGKIQVTTEDQPDGTGETVSPTFFTVGGTFARRITENISFGLTANLLYEKMANVSATSISFTAGVQYLNIGGVDGLSVGVVVRNIGPTIKYDGSGLLRQANVSDALRENSVVKIEAASAELPSTIEIGLAYQKPLSTDNNITLSSLFQNNNFSNDEYKFGIEYSYKNQIFLRTGAVLSSKTEYQENIFGPAFGIGINSHIKSVELQVDYAYRKMQYFAGNHVFSIVLNF
jgi:hypothetical protein